MKTLYAAFLTALLLSFPAFATIINVPGDQPTIQAGIDAAADGDTVLVADSTWTGTGNKNIEFFGKAIVVMSENGPDYCIIDCENDGRGFYFHHGEDTTSVLTGIKISNGEAPTSSSGGAIMCSSSSPTISNCIISNNHSQNGSGGGIRLDNFSNPIFENCTISDNSSEYGGGGIYCVGNSCLMIKACIITGNTANNNGGGIYCYNSSPVIIDSEITGNSANYGGGIHCSNSSSPVITNCIINGNSVSTDGGGICSLGANPNISYCEISENSCDYDGGGIYHAGSNGQIINCTISVNTAGRYGGGIGLQTNSAPIIINTIVEGNNGDGGLNIRNSPDVSVIYSDFYDNEVGNFTGNSIPVGLGVITTTNANGDSCDQFYNILLNPLFYSTTGDSAFYLTSNSPCIDAGDPTYPLDPDSTITDMGAYYFHQEFIPISIVLTPHNPPIQIQSGGGSFQFDLEIVNNDTVAYIIDVWTDITLPGGSVYPVITREGINFPIGGNISREDLTQFVPATAIAGEYVYNAYVRDYRTWEVLAVDSFPFEKIPGDGLPQHNLGWSLFGWDEDELTLALPAEYDISHPYPNPFNPTTRFTLKLPSAGEVSLIIYNIQGRKVARIIDGWKPAGVHELSFEAPGLSSGIYFARLVANEFQETRKLLLIK